MSRKPLYRESFPVKSGDFATAGNASRRMKLTLKKMGISPMIIRYVSIASYEMELNLVIHSEGGHLALELYEDKLKLISSDTGPGIPDVDLAMQEGWSTASEAVRSMGFGAGMGLPNIKRHSHEFEINSTVGKGTNIEAIYHI